MIFHVVALPHTQTTRAFGQCAYTQKVRKFCDMMTGLGHQVYLYASEENEANVYEHIICITKKQINYFLQEQDWFPDKYYKIPYKDDFPIWGIFNKEVVKQLQKRVRKGDFVLQTAGKSQAAISNAFPYNTVEYAVGYEGIYSRYRVFESYAWMHHVYGLQRMRTPSMYDAVIPNYYDISEFPYSDTKEDYLLFMSRPVPGKGIDIAKKIALATETRLVVAGAEKVEGPFVEWVGYADFKKRGELMGKAKALLCPTMVIEPFGGVVAEAQLCGTPVITTDWGAFTETVEEGKTGYRCRSLEQFIYSTKVVSTLDPYYISSRANKLYSTETAAEMYHNYFIRLKPMIDKAIMFSQT